MWPDGANFVGEFREGLPLPGGTYTFPNGRRYVGKWTERVRTIERPILVDEAAAYRLYGACWESMHGSAVKRAGGSL